MSSHRSPHRRPRALPLKRFRASRRIVQRIEAGELVVRRPHMATSRRGREDCRALRVNKRVDREDHGGQVGEYDVRFVLGGHVRGEAHVGGKSRVGVVQPKVPHDVVARRWVARRLLDRRPASQLVDLVGGIWVAVVSGGDIFDLPPVEDVHLERFTQYGEIEYVSEWNYARSGSWYNGSFIS